MKRRTLLLVCFTLIMSVLPATAGSVFDDENEQQPQVGTANTSVGAPGAQLASTIAVEGIDVRNEHRQRTLTIELRQATTPEDRAAIVATAVRSANESLDTLETELRQLRTARQAGRITADQYEAERAAITADAEGIERMLGQLRPVAAQLSVQELDDRASSARVIDRLSERASALAAGEISQSTPLGGDDDGESSPDETTSDAESSSTSTDNGSSGDDNDNGDSATEPATDSSDNESNDDGNDDSDVDSSDDDDDNDDSDDDGDTDD